MNQEELRAFLSLLMVSDPWPLKENERALMVEVAERESRAFGFPDWITAYHAL